MVVRLVLRPVSANPSLGLGTAPTRKQNHKCNRLPFAVEISITCSPTNRRQYLTSRIIRITIFSCQNALTVSGSTVYVHLQWRLHLCRLPLSETTGNDCDNVSPLMPILFHCLVLPSVKNNCPRNFTGSIFDVDIAIIASGVLLMMIPEIRCWVASSAVAITRQPVASIMATNLATVTLNGGKHFQ